METCEIDILVTTSCVLFSIPGLRTLCIAMAELEPEEFQRWSDIYYKASTSLENREKNVDDAAELIEKVDQTFFASIPRIWQSELGVSFVRILN